MALRGVRISWLMLARKADFSRSDSRARSRAVIRACSCCLRAVISNKEPNRETGVLSLPTWSTMTFTSIQSVRTSFSSNGVRTRNSVLTVRNAPLTRDW